MERLAELKYDITKLDAKIENMQERINKMAFDDKTEVGIKFLASTVSYLKELREYKQLEEQGLLLRLPCKVGDTLYRLVPNLYREYVEIKIAQFVINKNGIYFITDKGVSWSADKIGKTVFLTKSEAEQKLKEMECD